MTQKTMDSKDRELRKTHAELEIYYDEFCRIFHQRSLAPVVRISWSAVSWYFVNHIEVSEAVDRYIIARMERQPNGDIKR